MVVIQCCLFFSLLYVTCIEASPADESAERAPGYRTLLEKAKRNSQMETRDVQETAPGMRQLQTFARSAETRSAVGLVVFNAYHTSDKVVNEREKLKFENIEYNDGNGYNPSTGVFTAPTSGLYTFSTFLCTPTNYYLYFKIKTSTGKTLLKGSNHDQTYKSCVSGTVYVPLQQGDGVWVESNNDSPDEVLLEDWWRANRFSGALISSN